MGAVWHHEVEDEVEDSHTARSPRRRQCCAQCNLFFHLVNIVVSYIYFFDPPPHLVIPSEMSMATACVSGLFLITANFSSDNGQAVARLSLGNPIGDNCCAAIATMFLRHPSSRRIGFEGQYAYVSGPVAFSVNSSTNTPYFDVRGASINPLTSYTPSSSDDEVSKFIDDSTAPPVLHGFQAYNFAFTTFHIVGIVVSVYGERGSENHHFTVNTECYNHEVC
jgi:hypothetical protein